MSVIDGFKTARPGRQALIVILASALILGVLIATYLLVLRKPYEVLFSDLRPTDAATILAELDKRKTPYRLRDHGETILVPSDLVDGARVNLGGDEAPLKGTVGFELFNKSDMGLTEFAQRINFQRALQGELARTIMGLDTVQFARVHLSLTEPTIFHDDQRPPKASVSVVARPGRSVFPATVLGIQNVVAAAVPNLVAADVVVVDEHGTIVSRTRDATTETPLAQARRGLEEYYSARVRDALRTQFPSTEVEVRTSILDIESASPSQQDLEQSLQSRRFGVRVGISFAGALDTPTETELRRIAQEAMAFNASLGDVIAVAPMSPTLAPVAEAASPIARTPAVTAVPIVSAPTMPILPVVLIGVMAVLALGAGALALRPRPALGRLSEQKRRSYAQALQRALGD